MAKIKLMIVDDELISRNTIKKLLEDNGSYEVVADFSDGNAALDWLRGNDIDILLCDMQMPGMNGVELIRMIHVINEFLPVIAISAFDNFDYVRGSLVNGAANYLLKHELTRKHLLSVLDQARDKYKIVPEERTIRHRVGYCFYDRKDFTADNIRSMADSGVLGLITGQIIGRWGNFFNCEAFGGFTNNLFAMRIKKSLVNPSMISQQLIDNEIVENGIAYIQVHPTFLYESVWNLCVLGFMLWYRKHKKFEGEMLWVYFLGYGLGRVWIEGLRTDQLKLPGSGLAVSQLLSRVGPDICGHHCL